MVDGAASRNTVTAGGRLYPMGGKTLAKSGIVRGIKLLGGELRGVWRIWGSESNWSGSEPAKMDGTGVEQ